MKRALIGGFLALIGTIWALTFSMVALGNLVSSWSNPPGRFLTTLLEMDLMPLFVVSVLLTLLGLVLMVAEYFRKDP